MGDCVRKNILLFFSVHAFYMYLWNRSLTFTKTLHLNHLSKGLAPHLGPNKIDTNILFSDWANRKDTQVFWLDLIYFVSLIYCLVQLVRCLLGRPGVFVSWRHERDIWSVCIFENVRGEFRERAVLYF